MLDNLCPTHEWVEASRNYSLDPIVGVLGHHWHFSTVMPSEFFRTFGVLVNRVFLGPVVSLLFL
jgi:hypothetical protein